MESLRGNRNARPSVDDVKRGVQTWIKQTPTAFFESGIVDNVPRWKSALLVKETVLKMKINKSMDFIESVLAAICFLSRATIVGLR